MKTLILIALLWCPLNAVGQDDLKQQIKTFRNSKRFSVNYDRFKDETWVKVGPFYVRDLSLEMTGLFSFEGQAQHKEVKSAFLVFNSLSRDWQFLRSQELHAIVDGQRLPLGDGVRTSRVNSGYGLYRRVTVSEQLVFTLSLETFNQIANSKSVDLRLGNAYELSLKDEHMQALRDLLSLIHNP